jgi:hypothetical protein
MGLVVRTGDILILFQMGLVVRTGDILILFQLGLGDRRYINTGSDGFSGQNMIYINTVSVGFRDQCRRRLIEAR